MKEKKVISLAIAWLVFLLAGVFLVWIAGKQFDKEFPPEVTVSVKTTEIKVLDKDAERLKIFVGMAEGIGWERYPADKPGVRCTLVPAREWYRVQCAMEDTTLFVDQELPSRFAVKEFLKGLYHDAAGAVSMMPVLRSKTFEA